MLMEPCCWADMVEDAREGDQSQQFDAINGIYEACRAAFLQS